jgi:hypothetical protein
LFWITISVLSSLTIFYAGWIENGDGTIFSISSGFSRYLHALDQTGQYASCWQEGQPCYYTTRLPAVPYFHHFLSFVLGHDLLTHILAKNLLAYGLTAAVLRWVLLERGISHLWCYLIYGVLYLYPISIRALPAMGAEEGYYAHILFALLLLLSGPSLSTARLHAVGTSLAILVLTKSTLAPFSLAVALLLIWRTRLSPPGLIPIAYVALALFSWSLWSHTTTSHWTYAADISSFDGVNFYKGNNPYVWTLYPRFHLDALGFADLTTPPKEILHDEWKIGKHFKERAIEYLIQDIPNTLWLLAFKAYTVFLSLVPPATVYVSQPIAVEDLLARARMPVSWTRNEFVMSILHAGAKLLLLVSILAATMAILKNKNGHNGLRRDGLRRNGLTYLTFLSMLVVPLVIGFAYTRHLAVLYGLAWLYLATGVAERLSRAHEARAVIR